MNDLAMKTKIDSSNKNPTENQV